jgi:hypothetical protein
MALPSRRGSAGWAFQFDGGQDGEFGELHCKLGHAVQIEPGLPAAVSQKREYFK